MKVKFYDPHPGLMGSLVPIPKVVKKIADELDGKISNFEEGFERIKKAVSKHYPNMKITTTEDKFACTPEFNKGGPIYKQEKRSGSILLSVGSFETVMHSWCVVKYEEVN